MPLEDSVTWHLVRTVHLIIIMLHHSTTYVDVAFCYRRSRVVCQSLCSSVVCLSREPAKTAEPIEMPFGLWTSANLECKSGTCCTRLAGNAGHKKSPFAHHRTTLSGYIFATKGRIDNRKKKLVKQQYLFQTTAQYGELWPTSGWDRSGSLGQFRVLAALLHGSQVVSISQTLHVEQRLPPMFAGRPSRWALDHILVLMMKYFASCRCFGFTYGCWAFNFLVSLFQEIID